MALKSKETIAANQQKITFDVDHDTFEAAINKVYKKTAKNITVPGFRKGKAPRALVEKMYGKGVFYEDAINEILPTVYPEVIKEVEETIVSRPEFDIESIDDTGVVLSATFFTKPEVEINDYFGLEIERPVTHATDEEVEEELKRVQTRNSRMLDITDRAAQMEDLVTIDFEGFVDGTPFDGGKAEGHQLKLGSGQFIPGFEEQVVGKNIGDEFDVVVTFPADYHAENLAGKEATFKCKLHAIKFNELPVLDDDFAKDVSEFDTLDEYKADIKTKKEEEHQKQADGRVDEAIMTALMEKLEADIPECMFENETENFVRDYDNRLRMNGLDLATYFKYTGMDLDTLRGQMRPDAEKQVKTRLALEKIAVKESIAVSEEEIEEEYKRLAEVYGMEADKVKEAVEADAIAEDLKVKKAIELVREKAVITEKAADAE
ncbi:MAG: trigger factor [Clostridia bacterium]|nr:trigger factor [Clostridia bacterium]MBQ8368855.1 trigger factor [Clostridia bacterium]MBQ8513155.1 trigger factor [Clostridia bacterium]